MRSIPFGLATLLLSGLLSGPPSGPATAQTNTPHTDPARSGVTNAPVGANVPAIAAPGAVTGLGNTARESGLPGTTAQGTPQGPSSINNAPVGANAAGTAAQDTPRRP